jgi:hypothetical protein
MTGGGDRHAEGKGLMNTTAAAAMKWTYVTRTVPH